MRREGWAGTGQVKAILKSSFQPTSVPSVPRKATNCPSPRGDGNGRKLRLALEVDLVYIIHDPHLAEALACRKGQE